MNTSKRGLPGFLGPRFSLKWLYRAANGCSVGSQRAGVVQRSFGSQLSSRTKEGKMGIFRRASLAPALATVAPLIATPAALAHGPEIVTFQPAERITPFVVQVSGTAQCEPGDFVFVSVDIRQRPDRSGSGFTSLECAETNQMFVVDVIGGPFHPGPATHIGSAFRTGPSGFAFGRDIRIIRL